MIRVFAILWGLWMILSGIDKILEGKLYLGSVTVVFGSTLLGLWVLVILGFKIKR